MERTVNIQIAGNQWHVNNLIGASQEELDSIVSQLANERRLNGDCVLLLYGRRGIERWSIADLSNRAARMQLLQRL